MDDLIDQLRQRYPNLDDAYWQHVTKLRERHPTISDDHFEQMAERDAIRHRLTELTVSLARLCGYYHAAGSIPVEHVAALIDLEQEAGNQT